MKITAILVPLVVYSATFLSTCNITLAAEQSKSGTQSANLTESSESAKLNEVFKTIVDPGALDVGDSLISPTSSLYFLKTLREKIELLLSSNDQMKSQRELEFAVRRLREVKTLIEENRQDLIEQTLQKYINHLDQADKIAQTEDLRIDIGSAAARHIYVLQSLFYNTGNEQAKKAIRIGMQKVLDYNWRLLESKNLSEEEYQKFTDLIALRQIAGCQFLNINIEGTATGEDERKALRAYAADCKAKAAQHFQQQINQLNIKY